MIKFTQDNNEPIWINPDKIIYMCAFSHTITRIVLRDGFTTYLKASPREVLNKLYPGREQIGGDNDFA